MAFLGLKIVHQFYLAQNPERRLRGNLLTPITKDCKRIEKKLYNGTTQHVLLNACKMSKGVTWNPSLPR